MVPGPAGVFDPTFTPGQRYAGVSWTDSTGMFWLYGAEQFSDLWAYDPSINQWARMDTGSSVVGSPVYGTMGSTGPTVNPGPAQFGHPAWVAQNGQLWVYGPNQGSDTWRYDIVAGDWAWMNGPGGFAAAVYGTLGVPGPNNHPGLVNETACEWVDAAGDPWLFNEITNAMWRFDVGLAQWVWEGGTIGGAPVYGTLGTPAPANEPGMAANCPFMGTLWCMWQDANFDFWMILNRGSVLNTNAEIWKYFGASGQWACMRIDAVPTGTTSQAYGTQCVEDATHAPIPRSETRARWVDDCDRVWTFGGVPMCMPSTYFGDLWCYDPATNNWTWVMGSPGAPAILGTQGVPSPANRPEPSAGGFHWVNTDGFWLYGGNANDPAAQNMLHYLPDTVVADFSSAVDSVACQHVSFTDQSITGCNKVKERIWDFGDPASGPDNTSTSAGPTHDYTSSGTFTVTLIVKNCTWDADTVQHQVTITCTTTVTLAGDTICTGDCTTLTADVLGGSAPYTFAWDNGITSIDAGPISVCPGVTTTYTVITTDSLLASDTATATIVVVAPPVIDLGADTIACDAPITLDAGMASGVIWQDGSSGQFFNAGTNGLYWAEVDNGACTRRDSITITFTGPIVDLGPDTVTCFPSMLLDTGIPDAQHLWQDGSMAHTFPVGAPGTYWVQVTDSAGCSAADTIVVSLDSIIVELGPDQLICIGEQVLLDAQNTGATFLWQDGSVAQQFSAGASGMYWAQAINGQCADADTVVVSAYLPTAIALASDTAGCPPLQIQFTDASTTPFGAITAWFWQFGDMSNSNAQDPAHIYVNPGAYQATLIITTSEGCMDADSVQTTILVYPIPGADFVFDPPGATMLDATIHFTDSSVGATAWLWDLGDGSTSTEQNPEHAYLEAGTYTVQLDVLNEFGCIASITYTLVITAVSSVYAPNAFTPNGDGINDVFRVEGEGITDLELLIFNRWGELIFDDEELEGGWDGEYHEMHVQDGVYVWKVHYRVADQPGWQQATGHVTLLR